MYLHDLSPFALQFTETFGIRWYGLAYLAGFAAAFCLISHWSRKGIVPLAGQQISDFVFTIAIGTIVGGRLGYCAFYDPSLFTKLSDSFPFWGVLEINKGGMASHGGIIGIIVACLYFARTRKLPVRILFDVIAITGCLGIFFGRLANFVNGELYGRPTQVEWAVQFPQEMFQWIHDEPAKLELLVPAVRYIGIDEGRWRSVVGSAPDSPLVYNSIERLIQSVQKGDLRIGIELQKVISGRHASQLYEAFLEGLLLFLILYFLFSRSHRPGLAASGFLILYPIARIIGEQFRMPDPQIGFQMWGLTRGQWLSIGMLVTGVVISSVLLKNKSRVEPFLG